MHKILLAFYYECSDIGNCQYLFQLSQISAVKELIIYKLRICHSNFFYIIVFYDCFNHFYIYCDNFFMTICFLPVTTTV